MTEAADKICQGCGKPVAPFEPRYAGREHNEEYWHYDCWANTSAGAASIALQHELSALPKKLTSPKKQLDAQGGRDGHCPDGFLCNGWRLVRQGGIVRFGHGRHQHEFLVELVGQYVFCEISDWTGIEVTVYPWGLAQRDAPNGRIYPERLADQAKD